MKLLIYDNAEWPARVRDLRTRLGLGQERFGRLIGVSHATVSCWEAGKHVPSIKCEMKLRALHLKLWREEHVVVTNEVRGKARHSIARQWKSAAGHCKGTAWRG